MSHSTGCSLPNLPEESTYARLGKSQLASEPCVAFPRLHSKAKYLISLALAFVISLSFQSCTKPSLSTPPKWIDFKWITLQENGHHYERAALLVPVSLNGIVGSDYYFQLDTGVGYSMVYEVPLRQLLAMNHKPDQVGTEVRISGEIAGQAVHDLSLSVRKGFGVPLTDTNPTPDVGTLGLDFFEHRVLLLDFPSSRFAILNERDPLPPELQTRATFLPATVKEGKFYIPVTINDRTYTSGFYFDTGSSSTPILTSLSFWQDITKLHGNESAIVTMTAESWGHEYKWIAAPIQGTMRVGPAFLVHPLAYCKAGGDNSYRDNAEKPGGAIGNVLFYDRFLVIVDIPHRHFGLVLDSQSDLDQSKKQ